MSSTRKLTDIPSCMRMSFIYPWENSPKKEIFDPLSYDPPDITSDFEAIYGEGAAGNFFSPAPLPSTLAKRDKSLLALQGDSPHADVYFELFEPGLTPESPPTSESSPSSTSGYASDLSSLFFSSPSPSPKRGAPGGKKERQTTSRNARTRRFPYQRRPFDPPLNAAVSPSLSDHSKLSTSPTSSPRSSAFSNSDGVLTPEFIRSLQVRVPRTPTTGPSSLPESHGLVFHPQQPSSSPLKSRPPSHPAQNADANGSHQPEAFADRYCRFPGCTKRFPDKRTTGRHRRTHLTFGTYICPNQDCDSRTKPRPHFASDFSLGRHLKLAAPGSPCAVGKGERPSSFGINSAYVDALIRQSLVPFDPAIHIPF